MTYIRYRTIKGKQYAHQQTSVRVAKKVNTISKCLGDTAVAPLVGVGFATEYEKRSNQRGHKSTDEKEMQNPRECFRREAAKTVSVRARGQSAQLKATGDQFWESVSEEMQAFEAALKNRPEARHLGATRSRGCVNAGYR